MQVIEFASHLSKIAIRWILILKHLIILLMTGAIARALRTFRFRLTDPKRVDVFEFDFRKGLFAKLNRLGTVNSFEVSHIIQESSISSLTDFTRGLQESLRINVR